MRSLVPFLPFALLSLIVAVLTVWTIWLTRKRGGRLQFLDFAGQLSGLVIVLAVTVPMPRAAEIAAIVCGAGLWIYTAWGHFRRAMSIGARRVDGSPDGR